MILGRDPLKALVLNLELSDNVIEVDYRPFKGSTEPMVDLGKCEFKDLNIGKMTSEESFKNAYAEEINEL